MIYKRENHIFADFNDLRSDNTGKMDNGENEAGPSVPADSDLDFDDSERDPRDQDEINENQNEGLYRQPRISQIKSMAKTSII